MQISYEDSVKLDVEEVIELYRRSTLGERRPVERPDQFAAMLANANLIITAWDEKKLVGIARSLTDFAYVAYLSDLAVDQAYQKMGIGQRLIAETKQRLWPECKIVLFSAPLANAYYPKLGFESNPRGWMLHGAT